MNQANVIHFLQKLAWEYLSLSPDFKELIAFFQHDQFETPEKQVLVSTMLKRLSLRVEILD